MAAIFQEIVPQGPGYANSDDNKISGEELKEDLLAPEAPILEVTPAVSSPRTKVSYESFGEFMKTFATRLKETFTKRFIFALCAGQVLSWCITGTNTITTELVLRGFTLSTTQTFFLYFALFIIYTPYTIYQYSFMGWLRLIAKDGWKYILLGALDVEGNFLVVKAYQYTTLLSCELLDAWAIPVCMVVSYFIMKTRYRWLQIIGILTAVLGLGLLVAADHLTSKDYAAVNMPLGDGYMIVGATFYGIDNALEESFVRKRPLFEVIGQLGMWGMLINFIQAMGLEYHLFKETTWDGGVIGFLFLYTFCMFILYTLTPILYRQSSAVFYNLSLLTSDFFGLLIGLSIYSYSPYFLYFVAFAVVILGLVVYFWSSPDGEVEVVGDNQLDINRPTYVKQQSQTRDVEAGDSA